MNSTPRVTSLRGWRISRYEDTLRGRVVWRAKRHGVGMNTNTYDGLIQMILTKDKP